MDGYRADKVFHELADPRAALNEAWRVLASGGRVVLVGQDWESFIIDSDDPDLTRTIVTARASAVVSPASLAATGICCWTTASPTWLWRFAPWSSSIP